MSYAPSLFDVEPGPPARADAGPAPAATVEHQDDEPGRRYRCPTCSGTVSVPDRRRTITLAEVRRVHEQSCPGRHRSNRQENKP